MNTQEENTYGDNLAKAATLLMNEDKLEEYTTTLIRVAIDEAIFCAMLDFQQMTKEEKANVVDDLIGSHHIRILDEIDNGTFNPKFTNEEHLERVTYIMDMQNTINEIKRKGEENG